MKKCPYAEWDPLGQQIEPRMKAHDIVCIHTMVGYLASTRDMFKKGGYSGTESTYGIGGDWGSDQLKDWDGKAFQWQDRAFTADANLEGNARLISIETADNAPATAAKIVKWTPKQVDTLVNIIAWECTPAAHSECPESWTCRKGVQWSGITVAIPPVMVEDSKPGRRGIAYHRQGIDPWRVSGGEQWSTAYGKECPGQTRITQLRHEVIPRVQQLLKGEDMTTAKENWEWDGIQAPEREPDKVKNPDWKPASYLRHTLNTVDELNDILRVAAKDANDALAQAEANRDSLSAIASRLSALDPDVASRKIIEAGVESARMVREAGEELLTKLDAIRLDINRE